MSADQPTPLDHRLAMDLATEAGELLMRIRAEMVADGADSATLKREGDRQAHRLLMERLAEAAGDDAVLSEEGGTDDGPSGTDRLGARRVWIVDPLDGTREYSEPPRTDWAVHVALVIDGVPAAGAVALPAQGFTLATVPPPRCAAAATASPEAGRQPYPSTGRSAGTGRGPGG